MTYKEVAKYQQTFISSAGAASFKFAFYQVYKQQARNKFRLRVVTLADLNPATGATQHMYFAKDLAGGSALCSEVSGSPTGLISNEFCLGVAPRNFFTMASNTSGVCVYTAPELILDDLSTTPFDIVYRDMGQTTYGTALVDVCVVFEITEIEYLR
jgi:hypothetical protein